MIRFSDMLYCFYFTCATQKEPTTPYEVVDSAFLEHKRNKTYGLSLSQIYDLCKYLFVNFPNNSPNMDNVTVQLPKSISHIRRMKKYLPLYNKNTLAADALCLPHTAT